MCEPQGQCHTFKIKMAKSKPLRIVRTAAILSTFVHFGPYLTGDNLKMNKKGALWDPSLSLRAMGANSIRCETQ